MVEQPEIHLHPAVQAGLADVFVDAIKHRNVQLVVESHSEHLLRRLQRRLAEEQIGRDDVALYFVDTVAGESRLHPLEVDSYGNITNWPKDFFGDEMGDLAAMAEAAMKRKDCRTRCRLMHWGVDTNVARVANAPHDATHASPECVLACVRRIREITARGGLLLDDGWLIIGEYRSQLRSAGQPGVGDAFLRAVLTRHADLSWCTHVPITPHQDRGFEEFPDDVRLAAFDPSDRKFVAVNLAGPRPSMIVNARR